MLLRVISGGQSGPDIASQRAAKSVALETGGCMPKGFRCLQNGRDVYRPDYAELYGMYEHTSPEWAPRTRENVAKSDATILLATDLYSRGSRCTRKACETEGKTLIEVRLDFWPGRFGRELVAFLGADRINPANLADLIHARGWQTLNIAGNRDDALEGPVEAWLVEIFQELLEMEARETFGCNTCNTTTCSH